MPPIPSHTTARKPPWRTKSVSSGSAKPNESCWEWRAPMCCALPGRKRMLRLARSGARGRPRILVAAERDQHQLGQPDLDDVVAVHLRGRVHDLAVQVDETRGFSGQDPEELFLGIE